MYPRYFKEANDKVIQAVIEYIANSKDITTTLRMILKSAKNNVSNVSGIGKVNTLALMNEIGEERSDASRKIVGSFADESIAEYLRTNRKNVLDYLKYKSEVSNVFKQKVDKLFKVLDAKKFKSIKQSKFLTHIAKYTRLSNAENEIRMIIQNMPNASPKIKLITNAFPSESAWFSSLNDFIEFCKENTIPGVKYLSDSEFKNNTKNQWNKNKTEFMLLFNKYKTTKDKKVVDEIFNKTFSLGISIQLIQDKFIQFMRA
jgi:hypothetical protein